VKFALLFGFFGEFFSLLLVFFFLLILLLLLLASTGAVGLAVRGAIADVWAVAIEC
jgi:hypothetical protein